MCALLCVCVRVCVYALGGCCMAGVLDVIGSGSDFQRGNSIDIDGWLSPGPEAQHNPGRARGGWGLALACSFQLQGSGPELTAKAFVQQGLEARESQGGEGAARD